MEESEQEWFGYGFIGEDSGPEEIERQFVENVRYAEFWCRHLGFEKKGVSLPSVFRYFSTSYRMTASVL